jgi:hypothetical protein
MIGAGQASTEAWCPTGGRGRELSVAVTNRRLWRRAVNGLESHLETFRPIERPAHELALEAERSAAEAPQACHSERGMQQAIGGNRAMSLRPRDPPRRSNADTILP